MTSKKYFCSTLILAFLVVTAFISFNIYMNEYGLWGNAKGKSIQVWNDERTSKYLLSYNYIPANFEGILIGPSVSANLNTKKISEFKIYNASFNGANISELKYIAENVISRGNLKFMIICLFPYMTKDHGRKTSSIDPKEYWRSLGSKQMLRLYQQKYRVRLGLMEKSTYNDYGYNNFNIFYENNANPTIPNNNKNEKSLKRANKPNNTKGIFIDEVAYNELLQTVNLARAKGVQIFGFYHPYYIENFNEESFKSYKDRIDKIFTKQDFIWNMNTNEYMHFRCDISNYFDKSHFSWKGADFIIKEINNKLKCFYGHKSGNTISSL